MIMALSGTVWVTVRLVSARSLSLIPRVSQGRSHEDFRWWSLQASGCNCIFLIERVCDAVHSSDMLSIVAIKFGTMLESFLPEWRCIVTNRVKIVPIYLLWINPLS